MFTKGHEKPQVENQGKMERGCMNTRDIAVEYRLTHWAGIVQEHAVKGISVRKYCQEAGIHENIYFCWQRKLLEAAAACTKFR